MRQIKLSIFVLLAASISLFSCKKDKSKPATAEDVKEYKADVEDAGVKLVAELDGLATTKAATSVGSVNKKGVSGLKSSNPFGALAFSDTKSMAAALKSSSESIASSFASSARTYTWNAAKQDWDSVASPGRIVYKFPSTETGTSNNAEIAITEFAAAANSLSETGDAPSKIAAYIKVDGAEVAKYAFSASYNAEGIPSNVSTTLTVEGYELTVSGSFTTSKMTEGFSFTSSGTTVLAWNTTANGTFTQAAVDKVSAATESKDFTAASDLLSSLETSYQIFDIELSMDADIKSIISDIEAAAKSASSTTTQEDMNKKMLAAVNDNLDMKLAYTSGTLIATTEMVMLEGEYSMDFIFADDSRVAMDTYMDESMADVEVALENLMADFEENFK